MLGTELGGEEKSIRKRQAQTCLVSLSRCMTVWVTDVLLEAGDLSSCTVGQPAALCDPH